MTPYGGPAAGRESGESEAVAKADASGAVSMLVIYNPTAGWRRRQRLVRTLAHLRAAGAKVEVRQTARQGDARRFAGEVDPAVYDMVVVAGGDGTVNEVVNGLAGNEMPMGVIPLGTANVLAAEAGLSKRPKRIARTLMEGRRQRIAVGYANERRFSLMVGFGFDAKSVARVRRPVKRMIGKLAYVFAGMAEWLDDDFRPYHVTIDGVRYDAASGIVTNAHFYAGRYVIAPDARLQDPTLKVCLFERPGRWNAARYIVAMALGRLPNVAGYRILDAATVEVVSPDGHPAGEPVQGDGEIVSRLPLKAEIVPDAITLIVPR